MSKKTHKQKIAKLRWLTVLNENRHRFNTVWQMHTLKRLKELEFTSFGTIKANNTGLRVMKEFPSLVELWREKMERKMERDDA